MSKYILIKFDSRCNTVSIVDYDDDESELMKVLVEKLVESSDISLGIDDDSITYKIYEMKKYPKNNWNI